jgi:hypothetical protein
MPLILLTVLALLAASAPLLNVFYRNGYVFIDHETFPGLARLLFGVMLCNAGFAIGCLGFLLRSGHLALGLWVGLGVSTLFSLFFLYMNLICGKLTKNETFHARRPTPGLRFTSAPVVLDVGADAYSVVFAVSRRSQGYVTYTHDGAEKTAHCFDDGVKRVGRLHSVRIPRTELEGATYQVHARRVWERRSYGGRFGRTIHSAEFAMRRTLEVENPVILSVSDWHFRTKELLLAARQFAQSPDLVLFLGDGADYYVNEAHAVQHLLAPLAALSQSTAPVLFTRGNHEVRADYDMGDFWRKIGLQSGYSYQTVRGDLLFTVVDSAETPDDHDEWEHVGCYDMAAHLDRVLDWLEALPPQPGKYHIVLCHDASFNTPTAGRQDRYFAALKRLSVQFGVSGHSHGFGYDPALRGLYPNLQDGGCCTRKDAKNLFDIFTRRVYAFKAAQIVFKNGKVAHMECRDDLGGVLESIDV